MTNFTGLNAKGRAAMAEFLRENLKDQSLLDRQAHFEDDIDLDHNPGYYELAGRFTKSGHAVTFVFARDEMTTRKYGKVEKQRDKLLAALKEIADMESPRAGQRAEMKRIARRAIANAKR